MQKGKQRIDFIGLGIAKCGTSKLSELLSAHPEISLSEPRDIQYFNSTGSYLQKGINPNNSKSIDWYEQHFNHCSTEKLIGEFSTVYLYCPSAIAAIKERYPTIKLIVIVRQPAERAFSHYQMLRYFQKKRAALFCTTRTRSPRIY